MKPIKGEGKLSKTTYSLSVIMIATKYVHRPNIYTLFLVWKNWIPSAFEITW